MGQLIRSHLRCAVNQFFQMRPSDQRCIFKPSPIAPYMGRSLFILLSFVALLSPQTSIRAQEPQGGEAPYERYNAAFLKSGSEALRLLAEEWSGSSRPEERNMGMLANAAALMRAEDYPRCMEALDSLEQVVPSKDVIIRSTAYRLRSHVLTMLGDPERGVAAAESGLLLLRGSDLFKEKATLGMVRAEAMLMNGQFDDAFTAFMAVEQLADSLGFLFGQSGCENGMGLIRLNQRRYDEAWEHFRTALGIANHAGSEALAQNALSNLALVGIMTGEYAPALHLCDSLLQVLGDESPVFRVYLYNQAGFIHRELGHYTEALAYFAKALELKEVVGDIRVMAKTVQHRALTLWELGRRKEAIDQLKQAIKDGERLNWPDLVEEAHLELHDCYKELGECDGALYHLEAYTALSDSLHRVRYDEQLARSEALYGNAKNERVIAEQERSLLLAGMEERRKHRQRNLALALAAALVLVSVLLWRGLRIRKLLARKEKMLHSQQVDQLMKDQEIEAINAMLEGQEKERERMARDLHDRLGSMLSAIKMQVGALESGVQEVRADQTAQHQKVERMLDEAVGEVRRISHDMVAATLSRFGLAKALEDLCASVRVTGRLDVELQLFGLEHRLERSVEITVYRIVQELVSNVLKHANARELSISVTRTPGRLSLIVADDGKGFDPGGDADGIGLQNVRSRAASLGANVQVDPKPGVGTTVSLECPVVE
jgi:signal transduction histidine kinase